MRLRATLAAAAVLAATGCTAAATDDASKPDRTPSPAPAVVDDVDPAVPPMSDADIAEAAYLLNLRSEYPAAFLPIADRDLVDLGNGICAALEGGMTVEQVGFIGVDAGYTPAEAGWLVGSAVFAYCPELDGQLG